MSANDEETTGRVRLTDDEVRALVAQIAEAVRKGTEREPNRWDRFWERLPHVSTFVGSVVLGVVALMFNCNYNREQQREREAQAAAQKQDAERQAEFERQKFVAEERERQRKIILELSEKILSERPPEREGGQALLSHFYPGEAPHILRDITKGEPAEGQQVAGVIAQAEQSAKEAGAWGVVVGHDADPAGAQDEQRKAQGLGFAANIYKKGGRNQYITVAEASASEGGFNSVSDAEAARYTIRSQMREGAYVVRLKNWCQNPQPQPQGYVQCSNE